MTPDGRLDGLVLDFGLSFEDLHQREGLKRLDERWIDCLTAANPSLGGRYADARQLPDEIDSRTEAALLIEVGAHVDAFIARLFGIAEAFELLRAAHTRLDPLYRVKWKFVKRQALLGVPAQALVGFDADDARAMLVAAITSGSANRDTTAVQTDSPDVCLNVYLDDDFDELAFARAVLRWQADASTHSDRLDIARLYSAWAVTTDEGRKRHGHGVLFRHPSNIDPLDLLKDTVRDEHDGVSITTIRPDQIRRRLDHDRAPFALTDAGTGLAGALDESHYCLLCHKQGTDSCSTGLRQTPSGEGTAPWRRDAFGNPLSGCPLEERISEFHTLKRSGLAISALAMMMIDNPMVAATGHRICNDCMKACIYQAQTPVDIPQAETRTLKDVLELPWGLEIYSLLSRWNPLNLRRPLPATASGRKVLVVGTGPAGFTLAHHLMNDGHTVVAIDGLKIEPLAPSLSGVDPHGARVAFAPVRDIDSLHEDLDSRTISGFGGVAEYGITVRWDKNFLKIVRLLLERRDQFTLIGGVRFGGTLGVDDAWQLGFDHIALAIGAGKPTTLDIPNGLARGVRTASDFLMALQLTGAAQADSIANMQLRLPAVVIGGGLTAIDTATEALAYYVSQVDKFLARHEALVADIGPTAARAGWRADEHALADEFIAHARALKAERDEARSQARAARLVELLQSWGSVTVAYRRRLIDSPAYTLNHEELNRALEEGLRFAECLAPRRIDVDADAAVRSITFSQQHRDAQGRWQDGRDIELPARTVIIAAGTQPNTVLAREDGEHVVLDGRYFRALDESGQPVVPERGNPKPAVARVLMSGRPGERWISCFGDVHPSYAGNVVKAMASARQGYPVVSRVLATREPESRESAAAFSARLNHLLRARVARIERLAPAILEVVIHAPLAASRFMPGQFYRLQNFSSHATRVEHPNADNTLLAMEGLAMTGAWVDKEKGLVSTIVLEMGGSSDLCERLQIDEPVVMMGPTGSPTEIIGGQTVLLAGGGLGNAVLFSIGAALRASGSRVLYFAGYKKAADRFKVAQIEQAADVVVWCCDEAPGFVPSRPQDRAFIGNIVQAMQAWAEGAHLQAPAGIVGNADRPIRLQELDRLIVIGSDRMMAAVARARHRELAQYLNPSHTAIGSINSPMQCMMKEICAQCLQLQIDPLSGARRYVFSCFNQDQPLDAVDFDGLAQRLGQNSLQEKLTARWVKRCKAALKDA